MEAASKIPRRGEYRALLSTASTASGRMRLAGNGVFLVSAAATIVVAISWITGFYSWELAVPILWATITGGVLTGVAVRGQSYGIDLNAARLEAMLDADGPRAAADRDKKA